MPKYTKKNKATPPRRRTTADDDDGSVDDGVSSCSNISDLTSVYDETETGYSTANESFVAPDLIEERLDTIVEDLRKKDCQTRENALRTLQTLFCQRVIDDLDGRREDLVEVLVNSLRRGQESEGQVAATVTSLFILQLGEPNDELYQTFRDVLLPIVRDPSRSSSLRAKFAQTLAVLCFLLSEDVTSTVELMSVMEKIFAQSYLLPDGSTPTVESSLFELHSAALASWCLLISTLPTNLAHDTIRLFAPEKIPGLIESVDAELRNQAGEAIAVLYELAREIHSVFAEPPESLLTSLDAKAKESAKYKGKKEKRLQRATFREIYNYFEEGTSPEFDVKFGREKLDISTWSSRLQYNLFSNLLGAGITVHLKSNAFLRSIFHLTEPEPIDEKDKSARLDRQLANKVAFRLRTQVLNKTRANKALRQTYDD